MTPSRPIQTQATHQPPAGLLHLLPVPGRPWSHIALDFVTGLPPSKASETADLLCLHVFRLHGIPLDIVSDHGPQFISHVWKSFCAGLGASEEELAVPSVQAHLDHCRRTWELTRTALLRSADRNRRFADRHRTPAPIYQPGHLPNSSEHIIIIGIIIITIIIPALSFRPSASPVVDPTSRHWK
ncbi:hypothetical protein AAFF_G00355410 [Aldrovandia affinis]|uniref:Integrase catalytic domain-containing protein n=1 Tax=Aldrovandia affinis TaxID=143900 RepID=A0AAD7SIP1_9TELE|nr:hypothetical protein AAFF_G00355410 [Aldrovandia affinis]